MSTTKENTMDENVFWIRFFIITALTLATIAWSIAWGINRYAQTMVDSGMREVVVPTGYTTTWAVHGVGPQLEAK